MCHETILRTQQNNIILSQKPVELNNESLTLTGK